MQPDVNTVPAAPDEHPSRAARDTGLLPTWLKKLLLVGIVAAVGGALYWQYGHYLKMERLAAHESRLAEFATQNPVLILGGAFLVYVLVTAFSLPMAAVFTMAIGWLGKLMFGELPGLLIGTAVVSFASTSGATLAFLMSRYLFRDAILRKFGDRLERFNRQLEREGAFYLFTLRLIPAVPFFVINVVMGLTPIRLWTYWWVSQVGMLAGTFVYVYAGSQVPTLQVIADKGARGVLTPGIITAFVLLGLFPLAVKKIMGWIRPAQSSPE